MLSIERGLKRRQKGSGELPRTLKSLRNHRRHHTIALWATASATCIRGSLLEVATQIRRATRRALYHVSRSLDSLTMHRPENNGDSRLLQAYELGRKSMEADCAVPSDVRRLSAISTTHTNRRRKCQEAGGTVFPHVSMRRSTAIRVADTSDVSFRLQPFKQTRAPKK